MPRLLSLALPNTALILLPCAAVACGGSVKDAPVDGGGRPEGGLDSSAAMDATSLPTDGGEATDGTSALEAASVCPMGPTRCSGSQVETCGPDGGWGNGWPCATGSCVDGACAGSTTGAPSCRSGVDGQDNCGASKDSCCTSLDVPGGTFFRTYDMMLEDGGQPLGSGDAAVSPHDPATVSGFRLDKYAVTVGRFRPFVAAWNGGWRPQPGAGKHAHLNGGLGLVDDGQPGLYEPGWDPNDEPLVQPTDANLQCDRVATWTPAPGAQERFPINCVIRAEAFAFCIWDGGFLASDAENAYAEAGGSEQRLYPWGEADPGTHNEYAIYDCLYDNLCGTAPVGTATLGAGRWGQLDLVGNVAVFDVDYWVPVWGTPCVDCAHVRATKYATIRSGSYASPPLGYFLPWYSNGFPLTKRDPGDGIRCARTP